MLFQKLQVRVQQKNVNKLCGEQVNYYMKYAKLVIKVLKPPLFRRFIRWMLTRENIQDWKVENINVMFFPFRKKNGKGLAGKCNSRGEIWIYPKRREVYRRLKAKWGAEKSIAYIKNRAKITLIHELLHLKYRGNEHRVRKLAKKYLQTFNSGFGT